MPKKPLDSLTDIQKLADQAYPALSLASTLASANAPAKALQDLNKRFSSSEELMRSLESATEIAKRLTQHSDLAAKLTDALPKVEAHPTECFRHDKGIPAQTTGGYLCPINAACPSRQPNDKPAKLCTRGCPR
ncbi:hypothetical protein [Rhizobium sp. 28DA2]|uniref:hypothetical protein n=1 Tax=Rhizobium sp. 28DA2 TaxID=3035209 RepID=UPI002B252A46|nr:hypothetical protein [Rhizobium sp. 28DA2]